MFVVLAPVAYGLALQGVGLGTITTNLLPIEIARQMLWRSKTPWFAATAALFVLGTATAGARYMMDSSAYYNSMHSPAIARDNQVIGRVSRWQQEYTGINNTYHANVKRIDFFKNLMDRRSIWPQIYQTFYSSLPQAQASLAAKRKNWTIVLQSIQSTYQTNLSPLTGAAPGPAAPGRSAAGVAPAPMAGNGYEVVVTGYTPYDPPLRILEHFRDTIKDAAGLKSNLPFYIVIPSGSLHEARISDIVGTGGGSGTAGLGFSPWGATRGQFSSVFLPDYLPKVKTAPANNEATPPAGFNGGIPGGGAFPPGFPGGMPGGFQGGGGQSDNTTLGVIDPNTKKSLLHATAFKMTFLIYLR